MYTMSLTRWVLIITSSKKENSIHIKEELQKLQGAKSMATAPKTLLPSLIIVSTCQHQGESCNRDRYLCI